MIFTISLLDSDNSDHFRHFPSSFTLKSAIFSSSQDPKSTPSGRKVIRHRRKKREEEKKTMNLVATSFATQPVFNAARATHTLRSDQ
jgi:hypothetical protein